jgi:hypothetical protein
MGEYYLVEGFLRDEHININASINDMQVNRFFNTNNNAMQNNMLLSADMAASWDSINLFNAIINVTTFTAVIQGDTVQGTVSINISNDELSVNNLRLYYAGIRADMEEFQFNRMEGRVRAVASLQGLLINENIQGNISLDANLNQSNSWFDLNNAFNAFNGTLRFYNILYGGQRQESHVFVFLRNDRIFSVSGGIRDMLRFQIDNEGNFFAGLSAPVPVSATVTGTFRNGIIDARSNNFFLDLAGIWAMFVSIPDFNISAGYITGSVDIRGPITNPEFFGTARASSMRFQIPNFITEDLRPVPFNILAQGYEMTFGPVVTPVGGGCGIITGWFLFGNWIPVNIGLDISVPRDTAIPYGFNISGFLANGITAGNIEIFVDTINSMMRINGNLFSNSSELGLNMDEIMAQRESNSNREENNFQVVVDLSITAGSSVEFVWPSTSPILKVNPVMGTVIHISVDSLAGQYSLNSDVRIRSGELYYFDRSFFIRQGNIIFRENENEFNPRFSARAEIRDRSETGPVTISMIVDNQPLLNFEPRFEATPSLTQLEIYTILGQNFNTGGGEDPDGVNRFLFASTTDILTQVIASSDVLSQFVFFRQLERQMRDFLRLDMFSVRTRFLQNLAVTVGTTGFGQSPFDGSSRVGNYFDNTTVFMGKYIGQNMFFQTMVRLKYDENSTILGGLRPELDIGIELNSPFVNIRWDFFPFHPQNWWVSDNSITLSWSKSF